MILYRLLLIVVVACLASAQVSAASTQVYGTVVGTVPVTATLQSGATSNGNGTPLNFGTTNVYGTATFVVNCTVACSGGTTVNFEGTSDGTNWTSIDVLQLPENANTTYVSLVAPASTILTFKASVIGLQEIRARISAYSAGTLTVTAYAEPGSGWSEVVKLDSSNLGIGSPGTPSSLVSSIQGVSGMTPLDTNVKQFGGSTLSASNPLPEQLSQGGAILSLTNPLFTELSDGTNLLGAAAHPVQVSLANTAANSTAVKVDGSGVTQPISGTVTANAGTGNFNVISPVDPCRGAVASSTARINLTASGQIVTGTASKKTYVCAINFVTATAQNVALVEGTGTTCATNIYGLAGGTTAATGWNLAANGGIAQGTSAAAVITPSGDTNATAANVCLLLSGSGQTSGFITYVQQ